MEPLLAGFLHGCAAEPDDSIQRLILADWLDDHGQSERAAFVRLQCRLADWVPDWQQRQALIAEQDEQLARHRAAWLGPLDNQCERIDFVRGLARVRVTARTFASKAFRAAIDAHGGTALIESLRITRTGKVRRILSIPQLGDFPGLSLADLGLGDDALAEILQSPHAERLAALDLSNNHILLSGALQLARSDQLGRLARLEIRNNPLSDAAVLALLGSPRLTHLRDLDPMGPALKPETIERLAQWRAQRESGQTGPRRRVMNSLGMEFVRIPAGSFLMGAPDEEDGADERDNEWPQHAVTLTRPYYLGRFAVTQAAYESVMDDNPATFKGPNHPLERVSFEMALEFCQRLSALPAEQAAGRSYRLPTEAEWEHACRAGTFTPFHFGPPPSTDLVNYDGRYHYGGAPRGVYLARTQPVGTYPPNAFGLYEMHGNVWEWCQDWYAGSYGGLGSVDPPGPSEGERRVIRGGCWEAVGAYCRAAHRYGEDSDTQDSFTGFRVVLEPGERGVSAP